jgi:hypothetical protein
MHKTRNRVIECYFMKFHLVCSCLWKQLPAFYCSISCLALHFLVVANFSRIPCVCPSSKYMKLVLKIWDHPYSLLWFQNLHNKQSCQHSQLVRATLDEGPRSRDQWIQAILLVERFKLVPRPLDEGPRPKSGKLRVNLHGSCFGGKINWFRPKNSAKRRAPDLENQESG